MVLASLAVDRDREAIVSTSMDEEMRAWYKRKAEEIEEARRDLSRHQLDECNGVPILCAVCKKLEARLEQARYYGD